MKGEKFSAGEVIGMIIIYSLFFGLTLAIYPGWDSIGGFIRERVNINFNFEQNSAAWAQALLSGGSIFVVWWQTKKQLMENQKLRSDEDSRKYAATEKRIWFLVQQCLIACKNIKESYAMHLVSQEFKMRLIAAQQGYMTASIFEPTPGFSDPDWDRYKGMFESAINHLSDLPYWDIKDPELANDVIEIHNLAKSCFLALIDGRKKSIEIIDKLAEKIISVESRYKNK